MKRILISLAALILTSAAFAATTPFKTYATALSNASALGGTDFAVCIQGGNDVKCTMTQIQTFLGLGALATLNTATAATGGTGQTSYAVGDIPYASATTTISKLADVAAGSYLRSGGVTTAPLWSTVTLPNSSAVGDLLSVSATNVYANIADVATGQVLRSGGVTTLPAWGVVTAGDITTALASPPAIGGSAAAAGSFTTLGASSTVTLTSAPFVQTGNISLATTPTGGWGLVGTATPNYIDTSTTGGTITNAYLNALPLGNLETSTTTTYTNVAELFLPAPTCSAGGGATPTCTNLFSLIASGRIKSLGGMTITGAAVNINASSNFTTSIGTGSTTQLVSIGGGSNGVTIAASAGNLTLSNVTTGTNADFVCMASGNIVTLQTSACTISSLRFKENVAAYSRLAIPDLLKFDVDTFNMTARSKPNPDPNFGTAQIGLVAENIAKVVPKCAIYENDMKTPKSYRQECVIALLVKGMQEQQREIDSLKRVAHR